MFTGDAVSSIYRLAAGSGIASNGMEIGVAGFSNGTDNTVTRAGGYFEDDASNTYAYVGLRRSDGGVRKIEGTETVNTVVKDIYGHDVVLSAPEAPENLFMDFGQGKLENGRAYIQLDPTFSKNIVVNEKHPLRVFIQLEGDCKGVYVTNKSQRGFEVVELEGGRSNVPFTWSVVANRADEVNRDGSVARYSEERFAPATGPLRKEIVGNAKPDQRAIEAKIEEVKRLKEAEEERDAKKRAEEKRTPESTRGEETPPEKIEK